MSTSTDPTTSSNGPSVPTEITRVTGGSAGLAATYDHVLALARAYEQSSGRMRSWATIGGRTLGNLDLLESAPLSPVTFAEAEGLVLDATTGPDGILVDSLGWDLDAVAIQATVAAFRATDELVRAGFHTLDYTLDRIAGATLIALTPDLIGGGLLARVIYDRLPASLQDDVRTATGIGLRALEAWVIHHPGVLQHVIDGGDGLLGGPGWPFPSSTAAAARELAGLYRPEGDPDVRPVDLTVAGGDVQPGSVQDLIDHLSGVAGLSQGASSPANGTIEIQTIVGPDGVVRHIVYIPGTDDLATLPWTEDGDVRDLPANLHLIAGQLTTYQQGILAAMHDAGIRPGEPVLLVGHSQGGMEAAAILGGGSAYDVTNVVTAGSPIAGVHAYPPGSHVLSLEHRGDVVPQLDGADNPDTPHHVTVQFDDPGLDDGDIKDNHEFPHYSDGAAAVDSSTNPSIVDSVHSLHAHGFLAPHHGSGHGSGPATVTSQVFQITRGR